MPAEGAGRVSRGPTIWLAHAMGSGLRAASHLNAAGLILAALHFQRIRVLTYVEPMSIALSAATILLAAMQLYLLVRIEIDRQLFDALGTASGSNDLAALDDALGVLGWSSPKQASRSLKARALGAIRFVRLAGALTALQLLAAWLSLFQR